MKQKEIGNDTENMCLELLQKCGYWCHLFAYNKNGQPCDIIALKNDQSCLIDVKHCDGDRFNFNRIEANQRSCFEYAKECGNKNCGFFIFFEKHSFFGYISYEEVKKMEMAGYKSVKYDECYRW